VVNVASAAGPTLKIGWLDRVDGLGNFIELGGVAAPDDVDLSRLDALLADLRNAFGIEDADLLGGSYCDLVLAGTEP
jgi:adenylate cyclase class IV